ncbi:MAG: glycosyltransferase [Phycisphaerae bacterium]|jgi:glycosyltransferase involved in cell wall biosynthesis
MTQGDTIPATDAQSPEVSVVVIGRNEGERLKRCLGSIRAADYPQNRIELLYVDTDSTDDSCSVAESLGAKVISITPERRSAAAGRNAGLAVARHELVHFLDGDTILHPAWLAKAVETIIEPDVAGVYGRREEIAPDATLYNFWMHHDWYVPPGRVETCGGDVLFRRDALIEAGGYDASLIAGEERDLCFRLIRDQGITLIRLDEPMTRHDANMTRFGQYWHRCFRSGYAYAQVGARYPGLKAWRHTCARNLAHALVALVVIGLTIGLRSVIPLAVWLALLFLAIARDAARCRPQVGSTRGAILYALHHYLSKAPTIAGHLAYYRRHLFGGRPQALIEYRGTAPPRPTNPAAVAQTNEGAS